MIDPGLFQLDTGELIKKFKMLPLSSSDLLVIEAMFFVTKRNQRTMGF